MATGRRKPHCRTCGLPMEGHKRNTRGSPICPSIPSGKNSFDGYPSEPPLAQSSPATKPQIADDARRATTPHPPVPPLKTLQSPSPRPALVIPETGPWHWRNPNFVERPRPPLRPPSPIASLVPTVLVDSEGNTIRSRRSRSKSNSDINSTGMQSVETTSSMLMDRLATMSKPVVSIFNTKFEDIPRIRMTADRLGFHTGIVHKPLDSDARLLDTVEKEEDENDVKVDVAYAKANRKKLQREREPSWWLVLGQNRATVQQVIDSHQRSLPGSIASANELVEGPKMVTLPHLIVVAVISAMVVICGMSML
ncbi:hypothetical protein AX15_001944 [Amanita polypyramis BW_CC]|nr:hypothetical protein AX15_001944 [Amanita polypyramis BW_CC]